MPKTLTREQLQSRKNKAVRFLEDVKLDPERADEVRAESLEHYAERRKITLTNPTRRKSPEIHEPEDQMATAKGQTKAELLEQIQDLQEENEELNSQLDTVTDRLESLLDVVAPDESDDADSDGEDGDDNGDDGDDEGEE